MDGPCDELFARTAFTLDEHSACAVSNLGKNIKNLLHTGATAYDVLEAVRARNVFPELFDGRKVTERFYAADDFPTGTSQDRRRDTNRTAFASCVYNVYCLTHDGRSSLDGFLQRTVAFADART